MDLTRRVEREVEVFKKLEFGCVRRRHMIARWMKDPKYYSLIRRVMLRGRSKLARVSPLKREGSAMEKHGVCAGEGEAPKPEKNAQADGKCCQGTQKCGGDVASKAAEAAAKPPKKTK